MNQAAISQKHFNLWGTKLQGSLHKSTSFSKKKKKERKKKEVSCSGLKPACLHSEPCNQVNPINKGTQTVSHIHFLKRNKFKNTAQRGMIQNKKQPYSSPILRTSNNPQPVPMSSSLSSSVLLATVAPQALKSNQSKLC